MPRPDRKFYKANAAFGRFGIRWSIPQIMTAEHNHGHIELNWLTDGSKEYLFNGKPLHIPSGRLVMFWAGIPHKTIGVNRGLENDSLQCNVYLPLDNFLQMPRLGELPATILAGGVVALSADTIGAETLRRWYDDYRSGSAERTDLLNAELGIMFRRASLTGWENLNPPWNEPTKTTTKSAAALSYVVKMTAFILEHLPESLTTTDVAKVVGLHPNYALNLFTSVMNISIHKFVVRMRLIRARSLLFETNLSIQNVAFNSGFPGKSQFYDQFHEAYGISPREMRKRFLTQI